MSIFESLGLVEKIEEQGESKPPVSLKQPVKKQALFPPPEGALSTIPVQGNENVYHRFKAMVDAMSGIDVEATKYVAAFAALKVQGVTKQALLQAISNDQRTADAEKQEFDTAFAQTYKTDVADKEGVMAEKSGEIAKLSNEIKQLDSEVKERKDQLTETSAKFNTEHTDKKQHLQSEVNKINSFIQ